MKTREYGGFTLIELSIVLMILGLLGAAILAATARDTRRAKLAALQSKMDIIEQALIGFREHNNRLPCPANGTLQVGNTYFGVEAATPGTCATTGSPSANYSDGLYTVVGVLPVVALGLPYDALYDPWGGQFTYAVDSRMTATGAFTTYLINNTTVGSIDIYHDLTVSSPTPAPVPTPADSAHTHAIAIVLSHGQDGHGAYQASGQRKTSQADNANELRNCHCDSTATTTPPINNSFVQEAYFSSASDPLNIFDDVLRYYQRGAFCTLADVNGT